MPTNTFSTYSAIGNREDLINLISNISPTDTPLFSNLSRTTATARLHEFQTDTLRARGVNAAIEGADFSAQQLDPTTRLSNVTQINDEHIKVTGTQEVVNKAGRDSEYAYQKSKAMKSMVNDIEYSLVNGTGNTGSSTVAREMTGILSWITTNVDSGTGTGTATVALTEANYNANLQLIWAAGGNPDVTYVNGFNKRKVASFTGGTGSTRTIAADAAKLVNAVDTYRSSFGELAVRPSRDVPNGQLITLESSKWRVAVLRPTFEKDIGNVGDSYVTQMVTELTLESLNEKASGKMTNLTTSGTV